VTKTAKLFNFLRIYNDYVMLAKYESHNLISLIYFVYANLLHTYFYLHLKKYLYILNIYDYIDMIKSYSRNNGSFNFPNCKAMEIGIEYLDRQKPLKNTIMLYLSSINIQQIIIISRFLEIGKIVLLSSYLYVAANTFLYNAANY